MSNDTWTICKTQFDSSTNRAYEELFTASGGYLHVRSSLEEHLFDAPQRLDYLRRPANITAERSVSSAAG